MIPKSMDYASLLEYDCSNSS